MPKVEIPKRGRGRPRKLILDKNSQSCKAGNSTVFSKIDSKSCQVPKRGRDRPCKIKGADCKLHPKVDENEKRAREKQELEKTATLGENETKPKKKRELEKTAIFWKMSLSQRELEPCQRKGVLALLREHCSSNSMIWFMLL